MCGIGGILWHNNKTDPSLARKLGTAISHRGPDATGFYDDDFLSFVHLRLAIIDLSPAGNQPYFDASGRYVMVYNGEMYNYQEVKKSFPDYPYKSTSDTEVLLASFVSRGPSCISLFKGMYAFAIWDKQERALYVFRDRLGVKPLYYYAGKDAFVFASEIRGILATGLVQRKLNKEALGDYFGFQSVGYPHSPVEGIVQLEAGSYLKIKDGKIEKKRYWSLEKKACQQEIRDKEEVHQIIRSLLRTAVERRLVSDVPVGAFLSGGIDSSVVVGLMAETSRTKPCTFNISFTEEEFDESRYAQLIAKKFDTDHHTIQLRPESMLDELENALGAMDTPSGDGINSYVVSKAIRKEGITVALSGMGGDELFAGYPFFKKFLDLQKRSSLFDLSSPLRRLSGNVLEKISSGKYNRISQLLAMDDVSIENAYPIFRQILSPAQISKLTRLASGNKHGIVEQLHTWSDAMDQYPHLSQVSVAEYLGYTQQTLLKDTDQMSMAVALEVREPYFDHELIEFVLAVPDSIKYPTYPKSLLVESVAPLLPDEIVHRRKQGFLFPWKLWLKKELRSFCESKIRNMSQRGFINGDSLMSYWKKFLNDDPAVRWAEVWLFVVLEYWMEKNGIQE